eukprot:3997496-Amphidinium_carterae.1
MMPLSSCANHSSLSTTHEQREYDIGAIDSVSCNKICPQKKKPTYENPTLVHVCENGPCVSYGVLWSCMKPTSTATPMQINVQTTIKDFTVQFAWSVCQSDDMSAAMQTCSEQENKDAARNFS